MEYKISSINEHTDLSKAHGKKIIVENDGTIGFSGAIGYFFYKKYDCLIWILEDNHSNDKYCYEKKKFTEQSSLVHFFSMHSNKDFWRIIIEEPDDEFKKSVKLINEFDIDHVNYIRKIIQSNIEKGDIRFNPNYSFNKLSDVTIDNLLNCKDPISISIKDKMKNAFHFINNKYMSKSFSLTTTKNNSDEESDYFYQNTYDSLYNYIVNNKNILEECSSKAQCVQIFMDWLFESYLLNIISNETKKNLIIYIGAWHSRSINKFLTSKRINLTLKEAEYLELLHPNEISCVWINKNILDISISSTKI